MGFGDFLKKAIKPIVGGGIGSAIGGGLMGPIGSAVGGGMGAHKAMTKEQKEDAARRKRQQEISGAMAGGRQRGEEEFRKLYGMDSSEVGGKVQDVLGRTEGRLAGRGGAATAEQTRGQTQISQLAAQQAAQGVSGGSAMRQREELKRNVNRDIGIQEEVEERQRLSDYQKLIGRIGGGAQKSIHGNIAESLAGVDVQVPQSKGMIPGIDGIAGTVICTELFEQGKMDQETFRADHLYGVQIRKEDPGVYEGYIMWAPSVVKLMRKSKLFTAAISLIAIPWAQHMKWAMGKTDKNNKLGHAINWIGQKACRTLWRIHEGFKVKKETSQRT